MARLEFFVTVMQNPSRFLVNMSQELLASEEHQEKQCQIIREEYQEILQLYHEVMEYRHMSCATDEEIKGEIEHLIKLLTPVVQMQPHHRLLQEIAAKGDNILTSFTTTITNKAPTATPASKEKESQNNTPTKTASSVTSNSNSSSVNESTSNSNSNTNGNNINSDNNGCTLA